MKFFNMKITDNMICAVNPKEGACNGDSGGPMIAQNQNGTYHQIGITSFGDIKIEFDPKNPINFTVLSLCLLQSPSVFSRVTAQLDWINEIIKK